MMTSQIINHTRVGFSNVSAKKNHKLNTKIAHNNFQRRAIKAKQANPFHNQHKLDKKIEHNK